MKKLFLFFLLFPFGVFAQVEEVDHTMHDVGIEEVSSEEDFRRRIPAHLKTGKPQYYHQDKLAGYILNDSILIPLKYEQLDYKYADFMICREPRKLYGAINKKGETVVPFEYNVLSQNAAGIVLGWKTGAGYGLMTPTGKELVPFEYKKGFFSIDSVVVLYAPDKQLIVKALDAENLKVLMDGDFEEISIESTGRRPIFAVKQQGRWGIMDYQKHLLVPCEYDKIHNVLDQHVVAVKNEKMGIVDLNGAPEVPFEYETINQRLKNGLFPFGVGISPGKQRWGLVDSTGRVVLPAEYDQVEQFYYCDLMKVKKDGKCGVLDPTGRLRVPLQFSDIMAWKHVFYEEKTGADGKKHRIQQDGYGIYFLQKPDNGQLGLWHIDKGEIIAPGELDFFEIFYPDGPIKVSKNGKDALFSIEGKQLIGFEYGTLGVSWRHPEFVTSYSGDKRTLVSTRTGKQIQPEYYDDWFFHNYNEMNGYFVTKIGNSTALHAPDGRRLTQHKYYTSMAPCGSLPEVEAVLPSGRKIVACAIYKGDAGLRFYAIDDTGAEYEYSKK